MAFPAFQKAPYARDLGKSDLSLHCSDQAGPDCATTIRPCSRPDRLRRSSGQGPANNRAGPAPDASARLPAEQPPARLASRRAISRHRDRDEPPRSNPWRTPTAMREAASPNEMLPGRSWLLLHDEFDTAVACLAIVGVVGGHRLCAAIANRGKPARRQAGSYQIIHHRLGTLFGQGLVRGTIAVRIGMSRDLDIGSRAA